MAKGRKKKSSGIEVEKVSVPHNRKLWMLQCALPFDPPYDDKRRMQEAAIIHQAENDRLARERQKIIDIYGSLVEHRIQLGLMEDKDLSHLGHFLECPSCGRMAKSDDGSMYKCTSYKCQNIWNAMD